MTNSLSKRSFDKQQHKRRQEQLTRGDNTKFMRANSWRPHHQYHKRPLRFPLVKCHSLNKEWSSYKKFTPLVPKKKIKIKFKKNQWLDARKKHLMTDDDDKLTTIITVMWETKCKHYKIKAAYCE